MESQFELTRFLFQRSLGFIYLIAFLIAFNQFTPLLGERGLLPVQSFLKRVRFWDAPSLFWINSSDRTFKFFAAFGIGLSALAVTGLSDSWGMTFSIIVWALLWLIYLSFVNVGQIFYGFGWETLLLEVGFLAIFLGSRHTQAPVILIWLLRWVLFRLMFGAGMIKLRGDRCWRDLTCMFYHYETQPLPNPLSIYFNRLPRFMHKASVLFTHFAELIVPWFYFAPGILGVMAGLITIFFQATLILSGNLSWLNYITIVLSIACFNDAFITKIFSWVPPSVAEMSTTRQGIILTLLAAVLALSIRPARNLFSRSQAMNASFEPLHLVNTYGAFGSVTKKRYEIILEGTEDPVISPSTVWKEYEFKAKPGNILRKPVWVSPYHYKLDWQIWFAAMSDYRYHPWILGLMKKLLEGDKAILGLLRENPFPDSVPQQIRAELYLYQFPKRGDKAFWRREKIGVYLPALSLENFK